MDADPAFFGAGGIGIEKHVGTDVNSENSFVYLAQSLVKGSQNQPRIVW